MIKKSPPVSDGNKRLKLNLRKETYYEKYKTSDV